MYIADSGRSLIGAHQRVAGVRGPITRTSKRILRYDFEVAGLLQVIEALRRGILVYGELIDGFADHEQVLAQHGPARAQQRLLVLPDGDRGQIHDDGDHDHQFEDGEATFLDSSFPPGLRPLQNIVPQDRVLLPVAAIGPVKRRAH
jgi:hypothetical protein